MTDANIAYTHFTIRDLFGDKPYCRLNGNVDLPVQGLAFDSRQVIPGSLFFAIKGSVLNGRDYIDQAIQAGAIGIVIEESEIDSLSEPQLFLKNLKSSLPLKLERGVVQRDHGVASPVYIHTADIRRALAEAAKEFYGIPDKELKIIGITGTSGKSTVAALTKCLIQGESKYGQNEAVGMIGTLEYSWREASLDACRTTPDPVTLYGILAKMRAAGCKSVVLEVTSHSLEQKRVYGLNIELAVFLNLTLEHLDYHKTEEAYFESKRKLFTGEMGYLPRSAVMNLDDAYGRRLLRDMNSKIEVTTFGFHENSDFRAKNIQLGAWGCRFDCIYPEGKLEVESPLLGYHNISNVLAAFAIAWKSGVHLNRAICQLKTFPGVPGRMEKVNRDEPFHVVVDFAHKTDALKHVLTTLREIAKGRLLLVFGCGGNRDKSKRPAMMAVAEALADLIWVTADNSRDEDTKVIFKDMRAGISGMQSVQCKKIYFEEDRRCAIDLALKEANPGDCVLIAGRGHERNLEIKGKQIPFDDREVVRELLLGQTHLKGM